VSHQGQPIALVIAETFEHANHAATLVRLSYASRTRTADLPRVGIRSADGRSRSGRPPARAGAAIPKKRFAPPR
jgi:xanthine dehydrogenase molybdopterin-binding subunit B